MVGHDRAPHRRAPQAVRFGGRVLAREDLARIRVLVAEHPGATLRELVTRVCRDRRWRRTNGELRLRTAQDLLRRLDRRGLIELPASCGGRAARRSTSPVPVGSFFAVPPAPIGPGDIALRAVRVRPLCHGERAAWDEAIVRFHYLGSARLVGESLRYVAEAEGRWLAVLGWGAAVLKSRHREAFVGWDAATKYQRLHLVANNLRFLILPWVRVPHLASRVLALTLRRLSADWEERYDHPIVLAETFVEVGRFAGISYRAANWRYLGETRGVGRQGAGFAPHGRKKALWVYPLHRQARQILSAPFPPVPLGRRTAPLTPVIDVNQLPIEGKGGLVERLSGITDPRRRRGIRHPITSVLALATMAALAGMRSYEAIAEWVNDLPQDLFQRLKCWCHRAPSEPTFRRVLQSIDADEIDAKVGQWLDGLIARKAISVDGKTLRGSADGDGKPGHLLAAITHETGIVVAQQPVADKSNEITAVQPLLAPLDLRGVTVTADAMHTQKEFARSLVEDQGADYVFIAKDNQPTLREDIALVEWAAMPVHAQTVDKGHGRIETRKIQLRDALDGYLKFPHARVVFRLERETCKLDGSLRRHEVVYGLTSRRGTDATAAVALLALVRGHWIVENRLHWVRDVTFDEDRSQVRKGNGPRVMATLRNLAISLLRLAGAPCIAKAVRWCARRPERSMRLIGLA